MKVQEMFYPRQIKWHAIVLLNEVETSEVDRETILGLFLEMGDVYMRYVSSNTIELNSGKPMYGSMVHGREALLAKIENRFVGIIAKGRRGIFVTIKDTDPEYPQMQKIYNIVESGYKKCDERNRRELTSRILYGEEEIRCDNL